MQYSMILLALVALASASIPNSFDARQKWGNCKWNILDQGRCGSCWDFASMESFSDRACISGEAPSGTVMSPEPILQCSRDACGGGNPNVAWNWVISNGDAVATNPPKLTGGCAPYDSYSCTQNGACSSCHLHKCDNGNAWPKKYTAAKFSSLSGISTFQNHLMNNGPLQACFTEYENFQPFFDDHPTGIYTQKSGSVMGGHCVKFIGWGVSGGTDYWLIANSWNTDWGNKGYFKFLRGKNLCGIEGQVSEGFTSKQAAMLEAQGFDFGNNTEVDTTIIGGGWHKQEDMEVDLWAEASKFGMAAISAETEKEFILEKVLEASTQVVNGVNFDILAQTVDGQQVKMELYRSHKMEWELTNYRLF